MLEHVILARHLGLRIEVDFRPFPKVGPRILGSASCCGFWAQIPGFEDAFFAQLRNSKTRAEIARRALEFQDTRSKFARPQVVYYMLNYEIFKSRDFGRIHSRLSRCPDY